MNEIWKPIVGYEGYYEVSSLGRVRSVDRIVTDGSRRRGRLRKLVPIGVDRQQYLSVVLSRGSVVKCVRVHAEVLRAFRGYAPLGYEARHRDGDARNNRLSNLRWGTAAQNLADKRRHGRIPAGARHWNWQR